MQDTEYEERKRFNAMAGEVIAWMDEKTWTDEEKLSLAAGLMPAFMLRLTKDKAKFDKIKEFFVKMIDASCENAWKIQSCTHEYKDKALGVIVCVKCGFIFPGRAS